MLNKIGNPTKNIPTSISFPSSDDFPFFAPKDIIDDIDCDEVTQNLDNLKINELVYLYNWAGLSGEEKIWFDSCEEF